MKFELRKASNWNAKAEIKISSLEELMEFIDKNGAIIVSIDKNRIVKTPEGKYESVDPVNCIQIYDDYIE